MEYTERLEEKRAAGIDRFASTGVPSALPEGRNVEGARERTLIILQDAWDQTGDDSAGSVRSSWAGCDGSLTLDCD